MEEQLQTARLEARMFRAGRAYLERSGFVEMLPPRVVRASGACENVNTLFEVSSAKNFCWFGTPQAKHQAYLAQTAQLYLEAFVPYFGKVYAAGPSFRAEEGNDERHLTEFQMVEIEFAGGFAELLAKVEGFIYAIVQDFVRAPREERELLGLGEKDIERLSRVSAVFPKITYDEAIAKLGLSWGDDISSKKEQELVRAMGGYPLFITRYPDPLWDHGKEIEVEKFFNMLPDAAHPGRVLSADLILPVAGEAVGAAARVDDPIMLERRLTHSRMFRRLVELGGNLDDFGWYIARIRERSVPHAGCGFGMARIARWLRGSDDIKRAVTFASNQYQII